MSRATLRAWGVTAGGAALLAGLFFACFERTTEEVEVGMSREAMQNRFLAMGRLLERMDVDVVWLDGPAELDTLPPSYGTIFYTTRRSTLSDKRSRELRAWVEAGGHLVLVTWSLWDAPGRRPDPLLDPLDFRQSQRIWPPLEPDEEREEETDPEDLLAEQRGIAEPEDFDPTPVAFEGRGEPLIVSFDPRYVFEPPSAPLQAAAAGAAGIHLLVARVGQGYVTALTDDLWLHNDRIGEDDHAELALRLARIGGRPGPSWIVVREEWPGLLALARKHAAPALASLAVLVAAWLWRASRRFGPVLPAPAPERRRWIEHLEAVGRFHWRHGRGEALLAGTREALDRRLQARHPTWRGLPPEQRVARLCQVSGLAEAAVRAALDPETRPTGESSFRNAVVTLERIRRAL